MEADWADGLEGRGEGFDEVAAEGWGEERRSNSSQIVPAEDLEPWAGCWEDNGADLVGGGTGAVDAGREGTKAGEEMRIGGAAVADDCDGGALPPVPPPTPFPPSWSQKAPWVWKAFDWASIFWRDSSASFAWRWAKDRLVVFALEEGERKERSELKASAPGEEAAGGAGDLGLGGWACWAARGEGE
jgi:hypothetical protein